MGDLTTIHEPKQAPEPRPSQAPAAPSQARVPSPGGWLQFATGRISTDQALRNLETAVSLLQTISADLAKIDAILEDAMTAVNTTWVQGDRTRPPPAEIGRYLRHRLVQVDEIVRHSRFHGRGLLDGQSGVVGIGTGVVFVRGGPNTVSSPADGFEVRIATLPTRTWMMGGVPMHEDWLREEQEIFLADGERFVRYAPAGGGSVEDFLRAFRTTIHGAGLDLDVGLTRERRLMVRHTQYGSQFKFKGCSRRTPLLSKRPGKLEWSRPGRDIQGTLAGEPAFGIGRLLVGYPDNALTAELAVAWTGEPLAEGSIARCYVVQNGICFQDADHAAGSEVRISLPSFYTSQLGRWVETRSRQESLADLRAESWDELLDSLQMLFSVSSEVEEWRDRVGLWIQRYQNRAMAYLRRGAPAGQEPVAEEQQAHEAEQMAVMLKKLIQAGGPMTR